MTPSYKVPRSGRFIETESRTAVARGWGCLMGTELQFRKMERALWLVVVVAAQPCECA